MTALFLKTDLKFFCRCSILNTVHGKYPTHKGRMKKSMYDLILKNANVIDRIGYL